jgi:hypothetical protein
METDSASLAIRIKIYIDIKIMNKRRWNRTWRVQTSNNSSWGNLMDLDEDLILY